MSFMTDVNFVARVGNDPVLRKTPAGTPVCSLNCAIDRSFTNDAGKRVEQTLWVKVVAWRALAQTTAKWVVKGQRLQVVGLLAEPDAWVDKTTGELRKLAVINAESIKFLDRPNGNPSGHIERNGTATEAPAAELAVDDIPF